MVWFFYLLGFLLVWYENRWIVCSYPLGRPLWFSPKNKSIFWIVRLAITYGSLFGLWKLHGFPIALIAFIVYYAFAKVAFRIYYNREVRETALRYVELMREEAQGNNEPIDEEMLVQEATEIAKRTVNQNVVT